MGHCGEYVSCTKVVTAGLKFSPLRNSQDKGHHPQVHREYILDRRDIIQSVSERSRLTGRAARHTPTEGRAI